MAIIKSFSSFQNLSNFSTFITDRNPNSDFFRVTEFKETFTGGKNGFLIEGSEFLKETTEVKIEVLDVEGNPIYYEPGKGAPDYYEGLSTLVSVHIYPDTPIGIGKITILGELKEYINENGTKVPVPEEWKGVYNVKWERTFKINRNLSNEDIVRFYRRPVVSISELVKPIFSKTIPSVTQSGSVEGIAIQPTAGSNLSTWTAGTLYKLKLTDGADWTGSVDENIISIPTLSYSPTVREVLNNIEVLVDIPYSIGNIVTNFNSTPFETTFEYVEGQTVTESALTGSFARINISNLKTFVGDVARVKVFRKSRNEVTDFQFVQESKLESTELLRDITVPNSTEISYGNFSDFNLSNYWLSSSDDHQLSINVDVLQSSVKTEYNSSLGGVQHLITSESFSITKDVEYTLTFKTLISGSLNGSEYLRGYLSSSDGYQQTFLTVSGSDVYKTRQIVSQNIIANPISSSDAKLVFEISGSDWYISNVSLKNAQETSFSPDEFLLVQEIPRKLAAETFDFRFEFYDINNNYIPVDVNASAVFDGGNDYPTSGKLLTFESDRNAFRFSTGSIQNPENQQVKFTLTQNNLVGTATFASSAFDVNGNYLNPTEYTKYPGELTSITPAGALLTINNFTGSRVDGLLTPYVGSIVYTASLDGLEEFETVYRLEDGENAPTLIVTSDANQFIYEPTRLSEKPSNQSITIRAQRKNLESYNTQITVNSGSNLPPLTEVVTTPNGVTTYTISAEDFSSSFAANNFDSVTYSFTGSDVYGNDYSDEVTISKVVNFDGISLVLSNESTTFPAKSTGEVVGGFAASSGSVQMFIGGNQIQHSDGLTSRNRFDITSVVGSGVTPTSSSPTNEFYSISDMTADSGSLTLSIEYLAGDDTTTQTFEKVVSYTKAKKAVPTVLTKTSPTTQTINSSSLGFETPQLVEVVLQEGGDEYTYLDPPSLPQTFKITGLGYSAGSASFSDEIITLFPSSSVGGIITSGIIGSASVDYRDSEGTLVQNKLVRFDLSVSKIGVDGINGSAGSGSFTVSLTSNKYSVTYDQFGLLAPAGQTITLTANASLAFDTPHFEFVSGSDVVQPYSTTNTYPVSPLPTPGQTILYQVNVKEGGNGDVLAFDNIDVFGLQSGSDAFTVFLTNEAHTFAANSDGVITSTLADGATEIRFFRGTQQYTYATSGTNTYSISATSSSIELLQSTVGNQRKFTPTSVSGDAGTATITITDNNTSNQFVKTYTFTRSKKGAPSAIILANPQSQTVTSGSAGIGTPTNVNIIVNEGGSNYTYATSGPSTFNITSVDGGTNSSGTITPTQPTNSTPINGVVTLNYRNSEGTSFTGKTINFNVGVAGIGNTGEKGDKGDEGDPGTPGATGPGITYVGECSALASSFVWANDAIARNVTSVSGTYYITLPAANNVAKSTTGCPPNATYFEALDSFASVATDILLAQDATITKTLTIGTFGSDQGIIRSANATSFTNGNGLWLDNNGDVRFGNPSGKYVSWDQSAGTLTISGDGTFSGTVNASGGNFTNNITIGGTLTAGTAKFGTGVVSGRNGIVINADNYWYYATSGGVVNFKVGSASNNMTYSTSTDTLVLTGNLTANSGAISGATLTGGTISITGTDAFSVNSDGKLTAAGADITGRITADDGNIGGWTIDSNKIYNGALALNATRPALEVGGDVDINTNSSLTDLGASGGGTFSTITGDQNNINNFTSVSNGGGSVSATINDTTGLLGSFTPSGIIAGDTVTFTHNGLNTYAFQSFNSYFEVDNLGTQTGYVTYKQVSYYSQLILCDSLGQEMATLTNSHNWDFAVGTLPPGYSTKYDFSIPGNYQPIYDTAGKSTTFTPTSTNMTYTPWKFKIKTFASALFAVSGLSIGYTSQIRVYLGTPAIQYAGGTTSVSVNKVEICAGGLQVVRTSTEFAKMDRSSGSSGAVMLQIGGAITATGNITANTSDIRLKDIIGGIDNPLFKLKKLNSIIYKNNEIAKQYGLLRDDLQVGLIAQEVNEILPEAVTIAPIDDDGMGNSKSGENYLTIWYDRLVPLLVESVKELSDKVDKLEEENKKLRNGD